MNIAAQIDELEGTEPADDARPAYRVFRCRRADGACWAFDPSGVLASAGLPRLGEHFPGNRGHVCVRRTVRFVSAHVARVVCKYKPIHAPQRVRR